MGNEDQKEREVFEYMSLAYDVSAAKTLVEGREADGEVYPPHWKEWIAKDTSDPSETPFDTPASE